MGIVCVMCNFFFGPGMFLSEKSDSNPTSEVWLMVVPPKFSLEVAVRLFGALAMSPDVHHGVPLQRSLVVVISGMAPSL